MWCASSVRATRPRTKIRSAFADAAWKSINQFRAVHGFAPLIRLRVLETAAHCHAHDMARRLYFDHVTLPGPSPFAPDVTHFPRLLFESNFGPAERLVATSFPAEIAWGENLAANRGFGGRSPRMAVQSWITSPAHLAAILNTNFQVGGIGCVEDARGQVYYCQEFAADAGDLPILSRNADLFRRSRN